MRYFYFKVINYLTKEKIMFNKSIGVSLKTKNHVDLDGDNIEVLIGDTGIGKSKALVSHLNKYPTDSNELYISLMGFEEIHDVLNAKCVDINELIKKETKLNITPYTSLSAETVGNVNRGNVIDIVENISKIVRESTYSKENVVFYNFNTLTNLINFINEDTIFPILFGRIYNSSLNLYTKTNLYIDSLDILNVKQPILRYFKNRITVVHLLNERYIEQKNDSFYFEDNGRNICYTTII